MRSVIATNLKSVVKLVPNLTDGIQSGIIPIGLFFGVTLKNKYFNLRERFGAPFSLHNEKV